MVFAGSSIGLLGEAQALGLVGELTLLNGSDLFLLLLSLGLLGGGSGSLSRLLLLLGGSGSGSSLGDGSGSNREGFGVGEVLLDLVRKVWSGHWFDEKSSSS